MILLWERKYDILSTPPHSFTLPVKEICSAKRLCGPFQVSFESFHLHLIVLNTPLTPAANTAQIHRVKSCFRKLGARASPIQNADFCITAFSFTAKEVGSSRAEGVLHVTLALSPRHIPTRRPKDIDPDSTTHFCSSLSLWNDPSPTSSPTFLFPLFFQSLAVRAYGLPYCKWITCWPAAFGANIPTTNMPESPQVKELHDRNAHINHIFASLTRQSLLLTFCSEGAREETDREPITPMYLQGTCQKLAWITEETQTRNTRERAHNCNNLSISCLANSQSVLDNENRCTEKTTRGGCTSGSPNNQHKLLIPPGWAAISAVDAYPLMLSWVSWKWYIQDVA